jgi:hypothetical protein
MPRGRRGRATTAIQAWADLQAKCLWEDQERYELGGRSRSQELTDARAVARRSRIKL